MANSNYRSLYREIISVLKNKGVNIDSFDGDYDDSLHSFLDLADELYELACEFNADPRISISQVSSND